ncbi:MAG: hypothetical protein IPL26_24650 [Leptospiraceae bacterium]|nr:hypothetical protein [Leptospiraceae bacterium]
MGNGEKLSVRQIQLIQGTVAILIEQLSLSKEEALIVISESLREELKASNVSFEFLEIGSLSYRQTFVRKLVQRVEAKISLFNNIPKERIKLAVDLFVKMLYESWASIGNQ